MSAGQVILARARHVLPDASAELIDDGAVVWQGESILAVGGFAELRTAYPQAECLQFSNHLIMPGLINAHDHGRGLGTLQMGVPDAPLEIWISGLFTLRAIDPYLAALFDGLTLLASGVTTTTHQHNPCNWANLEQELIDTARGYRDAGIRACIGLPLMDQNTLSYIGAKAFLERLPSPFAEEIRTAGLADPMPPSHDMIAVGRSLRDRWKNETQYWLCWGPVGPQWCSDRLLQEVSDVAGKEPVHIHTVETRTQAAYGLRVYGESPIAHLKTLGLLRQNVTCAHCVWVTDADISALAQSGAKVAHNPSSNLRLRSGTAPVLQLRNAGIVVGLGLDGGAINDDQDMWLEMRLARGLAVEPGAAGRALAAREVLAMATTAGAAITGGPGLMRGALKPDAASDMTIICLDRICSPYLDSRTDLVEAVFGRAKPSDVDAVIVGGTARIQSGKHVSIARKSVEDHLKEVLSEAKPPGQLAREALVGRLTAHLLALYADW